MAAKPKKNKKPTVKPEPSEDLSLDELESVTGGVVIQGMRTITLQTQTCMQDTLQTQSTMQDTLQTVSTMQTVSGIRSS